MTGHEEPNGSITVNKGKAEWLFYIVVSVISTGSLGTSSAVALALAQRDTNNAVLAKETAAYQGAVDAFQDTRLIRLEEQNTQDQKINDIVLEMKSTLVRIDERVLQVQETLRRELKP